MDSTQIISAFVTLFVVIDPVGLAPRFIALTCDMPAQRRRRIGWRAVAIAAVLMTLFGLAGEDPGPAHTLMIHLVMLTVLGIAALLFAMADPIARALGRTGTIVITRLFGMLLAALSIQFVIDGIKGTGLF